MLVISVSFFTFNNIVWCFYRCSLGYGVGMPVLPVRNNLRRPTSSHHFSSASRFQFQKGFASRCSWKCTSIVLIIACLLMAVALTYITSKFSKYNSHVMLNHKKYNLNLPHFRTNTFL